MRACDPEPGISANIRDMLYGRLIATPGHDCYPVESDALRQTLDEIAQ
jgi:hypothetical protein